MVRRCPDEMVKSTGLLKVDSSAIETTRYETAEKLSIKQASCRSMIPIHVLMHTATLRNVSASGQCGQSTERRLAMHEI